MIRNTFLLVMFLLCCSFEYTGYVKDNPSAKSDIKGKVASIIEISRESYIKEKSTEVIDTLETRYDATGKRTFEFYATQNHMYTKHTGTKLRTVYQQSFTFFYYNEKHQLTRKVNYTNYFDEKGNQYNDESDTVTIKYLYNKNGNEIEKRTARTSIPVEEIKTSYYNAQNELIFDYSTTSSETPNVRSETWIYKYEMRKGKKTVYNSIVTKTDTQLVWIDFYDKKGNNTGHKSFNGKLEGLTTTYDIDENFRLTKEAVNQPKQWEDTPNTVKTYSYYNFDKQGNYLKKISSEGRDYRRVISYY